MADKIPVTIISGWLGSGKTTLLQHVLKNREGLRIGVLVNDMAEVNVDGALIRQTVQASDEAEQQLTAKIDGDVNAPVVVHRTDDILEFSNGCICCTLRTDFVQQMAEMASMMIPRPAPHGEGKTDQNCRAFDHLIVEASGISEPMQIAEVFDADQEVEADVDDEMDEDARKLAEASHKLQQVARLDCTVTVVDATNFLRLYKTATTLIAERMAISDEDTRSVSELLAQQVEFADVILVNKIDIVAEEAKAELLALLGTLNPTACVYETERSQVPLNSIMFTNMFSLEKARSSPGWLRSLEEEHIPESKMYGITCFVYRSRVPFHPHRLHALIFGEQSDDSESGKEEADEGSTGGAEPASERTLFSSGGAPCLTKVMRSKGHAWLATDWGADFRLSWAQAGTAWEFQPAGPWWCVVPEEHWPADAESAIQKDMHSDTSIGDRKQELVFIGIHMDKAAIISALDDALLTASELETYQRFLDGDEKAECEVDGWSASWDFVVDDDDDDDEEEDEGESSDEVAAPAVAM